MSYHEQIKIFLWSKIVLRKLWKIFITLLRSPFWAWSANSISIWIITDISQRYHLRLMRDPTTEWLDSIGMQLTSFSRDIEVLLDSHTNKKVTFSNHRSFWSETGSNHIREPSSGDIISCWRFELFLAKFCFWYTTERNLRPFYDKFDLRSVLFWRISTTPAGNMSRHLIMYTWIKVSAAERISGTDRWRNKYHITFTVTKRAKISEIEGVNL